uniref:Exopolygalacturonase (ExoPG) (Poly(1,4-alpha-D-galacturonide)galacturonohydrolase)) n=1 Tax=Ganoderma boninense TaxID=34458 RepID=A0A5K1JV94_9APHY|nr:Exopolygalacturonase (ExoPG) (EC (Galacturan 1,4-alpha-galacturonidase) (Poly(1,4-alpha-D-galacturonide)galacturonohydrolase) [Ganoderma boninense]
MFRKIFIVALAAFATIVSSGPVPRQAPVTGKLTSHVPRFPLPVLVFPQEDIADGRTDPDVQILQFALTLEHLENAFYNASLAKFTVSDFMAAGYPSWVYGRFAEIAGHERTHVKYLTEALGSNAVPACTYDFGNTLDDPTSFANQSRVFETIGTSAYLGGAGVLQNKMYVAEAGSILAVERSHAGWVSSAVLKHQPWDGPFTIPLPASGVYSLAHPFITACPVTYPQLPIIPLPALTLSNSTPEPGSTVNFSFPQANFTSGTPYYAAWLDGLNVTYTDIAADGSTTVPGGLLGIVYVATVSSQETPSDSNLVSGFALIAYDYDSSTDDSEAGSPV